MNMEHIVIHRMTPVVPENVQEYEMKLSLMDYVKY